MLRAAILTVSALVIFFILTSPSSTGAQSISGIDCTTYNTETTIKEYGTVVWSLRWCVDYLSTRTGIPPSTPGGDNGLCDERIVVDSLTVKNLQCDWSYRLTVGQAAGSYRELYCEAYDHEYGSQNRQGIGYLYIACTDLDLYLYALTGRYW